MSIFDPDILRSVEVGQSVYTIKPTGELPPGELRRGGVVYTIGEERDEDTGFQRRVFYVVRPGRYMKFDRLSQDEVDPKRNERMNGSNVRNICRAIWAELGSGKGLFDSNVDRLEEASHSLKAVG